MAEDNGMRPVHPGEVLLQDYLQPLQMTALQFADRLRVPASRGEAVRCGDADIEAPLALRIVRVFGGDARSWLNLQATYGVRLAEEDAALQAELASIEAIGR
jgi:addiction module HigA family antidote